MFVAGPDVGDTQIKEATDSAQIRRCFKNDLRLVGSRATAAISTMPKGLSPLNWLDDFLYLPEVLYVLFFVWLICSGPGKFSVDYWLAGQLLR